MGVSLAGTWSCRRIRTPARIGVHEGLRARRWCATPILGTLHLKTARDTPNQTPWNWSSGRGRGLHKIGLFLGYDETGGLFGFYGREGRGPGAVASRRRARPPPAL